MTFVDYASVPPSEKLRRRSTHTHMSNYDRVFSKSLERTDWKDQPEPDTDADLKEYIAMYDDLNVDYVFIRAKDAETTFGVKVPNEDVAEFCNAHAPRFIGLAGVDPNKGMVAVRELEYAVKELGLRGLNLPCFELKLDINAKEMYPLYAKCIELNVPVNIHMGQSFSTATPMKFGLPRNIDEVLVHFPELKVISGVPGYPWVHELIGVAWRHRNMHIGINAVRPKVLTTEHSGFEPLIQYGNTLLQDQILVGSNWPLQPVDRFFSEIDALPLKVAVKEKWTGGNAARLFELG
jgi:predicted TIM-barrel fold metal-dependent hydrolase